MGEKMKKRIAIKASILFAAVVGVGVFLYQLLTGFGISGGSQKADHGVWPMNRTDGHWLEENGSKYYVDPSGRRVTGEQLIDNLVYCFDSNGVWNGNAPVLPTIISVQQSDEETAHISLTGGTTWIGDEAPVSYMTMDTVRYPKNIGEVAVTLYNHHDTPLTAGLGFRLLVWNGSAWIPSPADGLHYTEEGYPVQPDGALTMTCSFRNISLEAGRYLLIKEVQKPGDSSVRLSFSVEFELI
ncbi:MAG: hypothetical protein LBQ15_11515 [Clostridium sp.]|jgi:hypothetical protein|nr:hypothetical protein [Clostridium sp.]